MKISTTEGEIISISQKEIIWNALYLLESGAGGDDEVYLSLYPRRHGVRVSRDELRNVIDLFHSKYA